MGGDADYVHSISEPAPEWARSLQLENFALTLGIDTRGPDPEDEDNEEGGTALRWRIAAAAKTTKLEIEEYVYHTSESCISIS